MSFWPWVYLSSFGLLTVVNFAHGAMFMWGAYAGVSTLAITGNFWLALIAAPLVMGVVRAGGREGSHPAPVWSGYQLPLAADLRPPVYHDRNRPDFLGDFRLSLRRPPNRSAMPLNIFDVFFFPSYRLFVIGLTLAICIVLWFFLEKTNLGLIIRAGTRDPLMVRALGIDMSRIWWLVFGIGSALAGLAGILAAPIRSVFPGNGHGHAGGMLCGRGGRRYGKPERGDPGRHYYGRGQLPSPPFSIPRWRISSSSWSWPWSC